MNENTEIKTRELFEEALKLYREFNLKKMKKTKPLCEKALSQPEDE